MRELPENPAFRARGDFSGLQVAGYPTGEPDTSGFEDAPRASDGYRAIRWLIWTYFWLLMFEGALRKWVVPSFSNVLLVVRDPFVVLAYVVALRNNVFPKGRLISYTIVLGVVTFCVSLIGVATGSMNSKHLVTLYGLRTNFLHVPLIFLMAKALNFRDLRAFGKWMLLMAAPMAALVYLQFKSPGDAWVNLGAGTHEGEIARQVGTGVESGDLVRIRAAGIFSYNTGLGTYLCLVTAFVIYHFFLGKVYPKWLAVSAAIGAVAAAAVSGSRTTALSMGLVALAGAVCAVVKPKFVKGSVGIGVVGMLILLGLSQTQTFNQGVQVLGERFVTSEGFKIGVFERTLTTFTNAFEYVAGTGFFGKGLGLGTNAAGGIMTGSRAFLVAEAEWPRVVGEVGALLGFAYIALRLAILIYLFRMSFAALNRGESLAMLIFGMVATLMLNSPWGAGSWMSFSIFGAGLTLAAARPQTETSVEILPLLNPVPQIRARGRSIYAEHLHASNRKL